jgi:hypothetical protein
MQEDTEYETKEEFLLAWKNGFILSVVCIYYKIIENDCKGVKKIYDAEKNLPTPIAAMR